MSENVKVIQQFIDAWARLDPDELVDYFTDDGIYHNMPIDPVQGKENLRPFIAGFIGNWTKTDWETLNIIGAGDIVIAERVDNIEAGEIKVALPCVGVFEMHSGKIRAWRDYFDMATYMRAFEAS